VCGMHTKLVKVKDIKVNTLCDLWQSSSDTFDPKPSFMELQPRDHWSLRTKTSMLLTRFYFNVEETGKWPLKPRIMIELGKPV